MALAAPTLATLDVCSWRTPHPQLQFSETELRACPVPALLLWGGDDTVQTPQAGASAARLLPAGRLEVLPGGHGLWLEHPRRCGELLSGFLQTVERSAT